MLNRIRDKEVKALVEGGEMKLKSEIISLNNRLIKFRDNWLLSSKDDPRGR